MINENKYTISIFLSITCLTTLELSAARKKIEVVEPQTGTPINEEPLILPEVGRVEPKEIKTLRENPKSAVDSRARRILNWIKENPHTSAAIAGGTAGLLYGGYTIYTQNNKNSLRGSNESDDSHNRAKAKEAREDIQLKEAFEGIAPTGHFKNISKKDRNQMLSVFKTLVNDQKILRSNDDEDVNKSLKELELLYCLKDGVPLHHTDQDAAVKAQTKFEKIKKEVPEKKQREIKAKMEKKYSKLSPEMIERMGDLAIETEYQQSQKSKK